MEIHPCVADKTPEWLNIFDRVEHDIHNDTSPFSVTVVCLLGAPRRSVAMVVVTQDSMLFVSARRSTGAVAETCPFPVLFLPASSLRCLSYPLTRLSSMVDPHRCDYWQNSDSHTFTLKRPCDDPGCPGVLSLADDEPRLPLRT